MSNRAKIEDACALVEESEFVGLTDEQIDAIGIVVDAARPPTDTECETEAASYYVATRGLRRSMTAKEALIHAYEEGMRRTYRS